MRSSRMRMHDRFGCISNRAHMYMSAGCNSGSKMQHSHTPREVVQIDTKCYKMSLKLTPRPCRLCRVPTLLLGLQLVLLAIGMPQLAIVRLCNWRSLSLPPRRRALSVRAFVGSVPPCAQLPLVCAAAPLPDAGHRWWWRHARHRPRSPSGRWRDTGTSCAAAGVDERPWTCTERSWPT